MSTPTHLIAIDQGTTSTRAIVFDAAGTPTAVAQRELPQIYPRSGWVEHDADVIWADVVAVVREAMAKAGLDAAAVAGIGITNQRETTVLWDRESGRPIANAIVWQDRRTAAHCAELLGRGLLEMVRSRTGLLLDPYFSATKIAWLLENIDGARAAASRGALAFGTIDSWLLWKLTGGAVHGTDATNAARTMLFDIHAQEWDAELCDALGVPMAVLPQVYDCSSEFGITDPALFGGGIAIRGIAGDQQAATIGQACFEPGMIKSTYGTGCFAVLNTGAEPVRSDNQLLTTVAYRLAGKPTYALEGSIFVAGAAVQWLRDGLRLIASAPESEGIAASIDDPGEVVMVPAFTGLGAPYWDPDARGAILGLTRDTGIAEIVYATLASVCFQTRDLMEAMAADHGVPVTNLRVDGGMVTNNWLCERLASMLNVEVERPVVPETTALGAAYLAGLSAGVFDGLTDIAARWRREALFTPAWPEERREQAYARWRDAIARVRTAGS